MKPIWYFVGLLLLIMGTIVFVAGVFTFINPPPEQKVLASLHPDLWWGGVMMMSGAVFLLANRKKRVE